MNINLFKTETESSLERVGIDFGFLRSFAHLTIEKQHEIVLAYLKAVKVILHPDKNPHLPETERRRVAVLFNQFEELKDLNKFAKEMKIFRSDKSRTASELNEVRRDRKQLVDERKRTLKQLAALQEENNLLSVEVRKLKAKSSTSGINPQSG